MPVLEESELNNEIKKDRIKGVLFDVDGTLYHQPPLRAVMIFILLVKNIFSPVELIRNLRIIKAFRHAQELLRLKKNHVDNPIKEQLKEASMAVNLPLDVVSGVICKWFLEIPIPYIHFFKRKGIKTTLKFLAEKGIKLGVLSDYPSRGKLKALNIIDYFDVIIDADDQSLRGFKPDTNGFKIAAQKMGLNPSAIMYIGDRPDVDAVGAFKAGMHSAIIGRISVKNKTYSYIKIKSFMQLKELFSQ